MLFGRIRTSGHRWTVTLAVSMAALPVCCGRSFAEDGAKTALTTVLAHASSGPLRCEIRKNEVSDAVELTGVVTSSGAIAGKFSFTVTRSGHSGSSNIRQANKFELAADKESRIGQVRINLEPDANAAVELLVESDDGLQCLVKASLKQ